MWNECVPHLPYLKKLGEHFIINKKHPYFGQVQLEMILLNISAYDLTIYSSFDKSMYICNSCTHFTYVTFIT
jgi:hypothetical protein